MAARASCVVAAGSSGGAEVCHRGAGAKDRGPRSADTAAAQDLTAGNRADSANRGAARFVPLQMP